MQSCSTRAYFKLLLFGLESINSNATQSENNRSFSNILTDGRVFRNNNLVSQWNNNRTIIKCPSTITVTTSATSRSVGVKPENSVNKIGKNDVVTIKRLPKTFYPEANHDAVSRAGHGDRFNSCRVTLIFGHSKRTLFKTAPPFVTTSFKNFGLSRLRIVFDKEFCFWNPGYGLGYMLE